MVLRLTLEQTDNCVSSQSAKIGLEVFSKERASIYFSGPLPGSQWLSLLACLDQAGVRIVTDVEGLDFNEARIHRIAQECSGYISVFSNERLEHGNQAWRDLAALSALDSDIPHLVLTTPDVSENIVLHEDLVTISINKSLCFDVKRSALKGPHQICVERCELDPDFQTHLDEFLARICLHKRIPQFAFFIGRLERDFALAREAIRCAVERHAGIPCLWSDDGHRLKTNSVRQGTQQMLEVACFVIADLTLGPENPTMENPSRAHEIGLSIAYDRILMLCSKEPRRYPYFSIGDMQMFFWSDERDLYEHTVNWLYRERGLVGRTILNYRLSEWDANHQVNVKPAEFIYDSTRRYRWQQSQL